MGKHTGYRLQLYCQSLSINYLRKLKNIHIKIWEAGDVHRIYSARTGVAFLLPVKKS